MEQQLRQLLNELQSVINESILSSGRLAAVLDAFEQSGHNVMISVDAAIAGINCLNGSEVQEHRKAYSELCLTVDDQKFLQAMKIEA